MNLPLPVRLLALMGASARVQKRSRAPDRSRWRWSHPRRTPRMPHSGTLTREARVGSPRRDRRRSSSNEAREPRLTTSNSQWHKVRWGMGEIVDIHRNQHGHIRTVDVVEMEVNGKRSIKRRHGVQNFAPLEINDNLVDVLKKLKEPAAGLPDQV